MLTAKCNIKALLFMFSDLKNIVHHAFVPRGQIINKQLYQEVLARLRDAVRRKRPELWRENKNRLGVAP